jgi:hypothetical protein
MDLDSFLNAPGALTGGRDYTEVLNLAIELIADPVAWTQNAHARTADGETVKPSNPQAVCWCGLGAIAKCSNSLGIIPPQLIRYLDEFVEWKYPNRFEGFGDFNDYHSHEIVLGLLQEARSTMWEEVDSRRHE